MRTRPWLGRALAGAALGATAALAQVDGLTPAPQVWRWWRVDGEGVLAFFTTPRGASEGAVAARRQLARAAVAETQQALAEMTARTGQPLGGAVVNLTDVLPADFRAQRYVPQQGGVTLFLARDAWGDPLAPLPTDLWLRRRVRVQVAQAVLWHALTDKKVGGPVTRFFLRRLPPAWFLLGMAAHLAGDLEPIEEKILDASIVDDDPVPLSDLTLLSTLDAWKQEVAYQQARDFCAYLARRFGVPHSLEYLRKIRARPTRAAGVFARVFGEPLKVARAAWLSEARARARARLAAAEAPGAVRELLEVPGWLGPFSVSPDEGRIALGCNRRFPVGRLLDLSVASRFGKRSLTFQGGGPLVGPAVWVDDQTLVSLHARSTPHGERRLRIQSRRVRQDDGQTSFAETFGDAVGLGGRWLFQTLGARAPRTLEAPEMVALGLSPTRRILSVLGADAGTELRLYDLPPPAALRAGGEPTLRKVIPIPGAVSHAWSANEDSVLLLRRDRKGSSIERLHVPSSRREVLWSGEDAVRAVFGSRERVFFTRVGPDGVEQLDELNPRRGEVRTVLRDPGGILAPRAVEGGTWVLYGSVTPRGFVLKEAPLAHPAPVQLVTPAGPDDAPGGDPDLAAAMADLGPALSSTPDTPSTGYDDPETDGSTGDQVPTFRSGQDGAAAPGGHPLEPEGVSPEGQPGRFQLPDPAARPHGPMPIRAYRHRYNKPDDGFVADEDALGVTYEWRDPFNVKAISLAAWRGDSPHTGNWQALYYDNSRRPSWFVGAFDSDEEDLLGMLAFANFNQAVAQRGAMAGVALRTTPSQTWTLSAESKRLEYDPTVFAGRLPQVDPTTNLLRLRWTRNDLTIDGDRTVTPIGDRWLSFSLARSAFGGDARYWEMLGDARTYLPLKRSSDSLATRLTFGIREPDGGSARIPLDFTLGGPESLRGIRDASLSGERFIQTTFEYRRLLGRNSGIRKALEKMQLGALMRPLRFERLYAALFLDMGTAYTGPFQWGRVERSVGVELRSQGFLTALRPVAFRLGFAHGFGPLGENDVYLVTSTFF